MGHILLEKARNRRVEALWANRVGTKLKAERAEDSDWAVTAMRPQFGQIDLASARGRVRLFSARA